MPYLDPAKIVSAVVKSTERYLEHLNQSRGGQSRYRASGICIVEGKNILVENVLWNKYQCGLQKHLPIRVDSSATFVSNADPGNEIEIRIIEYERGTGLTCFIAKSGIEGNSGDVIIDYRWLVRRCLEWYQRHGVDIKRIEDLHAIQSNVLTLDGTQEENFSLAQQEAVKGIFASSLSYVWGPPGTGKTKCVLAKAARHSCNTNKRILVLASTNLAVDNALSALLDDEKIPEEKVARIGIPSEMFVNKHPGCCEERARQYEINQIRLSLTTVSDSIAVVEKQQAIWTQATRWKSELAVLEREETELHESIIAVQERISKLADVSDHENTLLKLVSEYDTKRRELDEMAFPQLVQDIETLEHDQTSTIRDISLLKNEQSALGFLVKVFTGRSRKLALRMCTLEEHLHSVETTLQRKSTKKDRVEPFVQELSEVICRLAIDCARIDNLIRSQISEIATLKQEQESLQARILICEEAIYDIEKRITGATQDTLHPSEDPTALLEKLCDEKNQLESRLLLFSQDLAGKMVLGMTLDGFIGLTLGTNLKIDRVFVDEAPYAPIAKVLPLMSLGCPIALLGDHCQLPPVCECENDEVIRAYWAKSSLFLEDAWRVGDNWAALNSLKEHDMVLFRTYILKKSYRYGNSLAALLDRHIYSNLGLLGSDNDDTSIECIDCVPIENPKKIKKENISEACAIIDFLETHWWQWAHAQPEPPTIGVLTLYKNQKNLIERLLQDRHGRFPEIRNVEVLNIHKAQGREWDCVLFSVSDTGNLKGNEPYFSDTGKLRGKAVLNTTISRTKLHLVVFLDMEYWRHRRPNSLLTDLVRQET